MDYEPSPYQSQPIYLELDEEQEDDESLYQGHGHTGETRAIHLFTEALSLSPLAFQLITFTAISLEPNLRDRIGGEPFREAGRQVEPFPKLQHCRQVSNRRERRHVPKVLKQRKGHVQSYPERPYPPCMIMIRYGAELVSESQPQAHSLSIAGSQFIHELPIIAESLQIIVASQSQEVARRLLPIACGIASRHFLIALRYLLIAHCKGHSWAGDRALNNHSQGFTLSKSHS